MQYSIKVLVVSVAIIIMVFIMIAVISLWAQGSALTIENFFNWMNSIISGGIPEPPLDNLGEAP